VQSPTWTVRVTKSARRQIIQVRIIGQTGAMNDDPLVVQVRRGDVVEAEMRVIGCAVDRHGKVLASFGDVDRVSFLRSSTKPIQAEPLLAADGELPQELMAIACASHTAQPEHLAAVDRLLARSGFIEADLLCGPEVTRPPGRRHNNCSGKHAGMLLASEHHGWSTHDYIDAQHPLQKAVLQSLSDKMRVPVNDIAIGTDGCGVPCHGVRLRNMALLYTALEPNIAESMRAYPGLVGGVDADDSQLMQLRKGWTAKRGAEGLLCAQTSDGIGLVLKGLDGGWRGMRPAMSELSNRIGLGRIEQWESIEIRNTRDVLVGAIAVA
jgi:L-asparaginase II